MFPKTLTTDRLRFDRACRENVAVDEFHRILSSDDGIEDVTRYLPWDPHETVQQTADRLDRMEREWNAGEVARYFVRPRASELGAGTLAGVTKLEVDRERAVETGRLGIWLRKRFWGRGYSGERADVMLELAFERLNLDRVEIRYRDGNERSQRAIERYVTAYGGQYDGRVRKHASDRDGEVAGDGTGTEDGVEAEAETEDVATIVEGHRYAISAAQYYDAVSVGAEPVEVRAGRLGDRTG